MLLWDQHACLPLDPATELEPLALHKAAGTTFVSINVGYGSHTSPDVLPVLESFRDQVLSSPERYVLAQSVGDVDDAMETDRLAVGFDLEDTNPLDGEVDMVARYRELGVGAMLLTYNGRNLAGHGCHDDPDGGITDFGRAVVAEMNTVGMIVDVAHCSIRTSLDACAVSTAPVIASHTACRALFEHERNVTDEQLRAVAATGGVVGITGVGIFLGENDTRVETLARHVEHAVELVGAAHVGIGSDYVYDSDDLNRELAAQPDLFPASYSRWGRVDFVTPAAVASLPDALRARGFGDEDIALVMGGSFRRVAAAVWR